MSFQLTHPHPITPKRRRTPDGDTGLSCSTVQTATTAKIPLHAVFLHGGDSKHTDAIPVWILVRLLVIIPVEINPQWQSGGGMLYG